MDKIERDVHVERYFPDVLAAAKELKALAAAENPEYKMLYEEAWKRFANTFVFQTDLYGVKRWESMLGIRPALNATLEMRRAVILSRIANDKPYTERWLQAFYDAFYGNEIINVKVNPNSYQLKLEGGANASAVMPQALKSARVYAPANLTIAGKVNWPQGLSLHMGVKRVIKRNIHIYQADAKTEAIESSNYLGVALMEEETVEIGG